MNSPSTCPATSVNRRRAASRSSSPAAVNGVGTAARTVSANGPEVCRRFGTPQIEQRPQANQPDEDDQDHIDDRQGGPGNAAEGQECLERPQHEEDRGRDPRPVPPSLV